MGYQESFIGGNSAKFNLLKKSVVKNGVDYYEDEGVYIPLVITLNNDVPFLGVAGDKFLYACGERYLQSHLDEFLNKKNHGGIRIVFCEEILEEFLKDCYDNGRIYPDMKTKYFTVESFNFE